MLGVRQLVFTRDLSACLRNAAKSIYSPEDYHYNYQHSAIEVHYLCITRVYGDLEQDRKNHIFVAQNIALIKI